jgi:hypothetical protein
MTADAKPIAMTAVAVHLCRGLADRAERADPTLVSYTLGLAAQLLGVSHFETPLSANDWMALHPHLRSIQRGAKQSGRQHT